MDKGRQADLKRIEKRLNTQQMQRTRELVTVGHDPLTGAPIQTVVAEEHYNGRLDRWGKDQAGRARAKILHEQNDDSEKGRKLRSLRHKLLQAAAAHDKKAEFDFAVQIRRLEGKEVDDY